MTATRNSKPINAIHKFSSLGKFIVIMSQFYDELSKVWGDRHVTKIVNMNATTLSNIQQYNVGNFVIMYKHLKEFAVGVRVWCRRLKII